MSGEKKKLFFLFLISETVFVDIWEGKKNTEPDAQNLIFCDLTALSVITG